MLGTVRGALQDCLRHSAAIRLLAALVLPRPGAGLRDQEEHTELKPLRACLEMAVVLSRALDRDLRWMRSTLPREALESGPLPAESALSVDDAQDSCEASSPGGTPTVEEHLRWLTLTVTAARALVTLGGSPVETFHQLGNDAQRRDLVDEALDVVCAHVAAVQRALPADAMTRAAPWQ
jgi:hypothetical protein